MSNVATYTINDIDRKVRVVHSDGRLSVEVLYDINNLTFWFPINSVENVDVCDDDFLMNAIAEADAVIANVFNIQHKQGE